VDVEVRFLVGFGEDVEQLELGAERRRATRAAQPRGEGLARLALAVEPTDHLDDRVRGALGGQLRRLLAERDLHLADAAAEQHLVAGRRAAVRTSLEPE